MQFFPSESKKKKVATHNGTPPRSRQGAAKEPPRSRQGAHFWIQWPQGCSRKSRRNKKNSPGHGTRDDDRISHALGTRPGEFSSLKQLLGITIRERTPGDRPSPIDEHRCPVADPQSPPTDTQSPVAGRPQLSEGGRRKRR